jgi:endonuclease/exonuclease/phosphatase family metal-dependent hydrolase
VVGLQEVGGAEPIEDLQEALGGTFPHRAVSAAPDGRGIRVAFLSKLAVEDQDEIVAFPPGPALDIHGLAANGDTPPITRMGRGALHIRVTKGNVSIHLITTHLKSKLLTFPRPGGSSFTPRDENERAQVAGIALMRRMAEAVTLRTRVNGFLVENDTTPLILMGDLNDVPEAQTSLLLNGPPGSEIGTLGFDRPDQGDDVRLFNLAGAIASERRYSRVHRGRGELLDQILVSEELVPHDQNNKRKVPTVESHVDFQDQLPSVSENPGERVGEIAPDHAPVTAAFTL